MNARVFSYEYRPYYTFSRLIPQVGFSPRRLLLYNNITLFLVSITLCAFSIYLCVVFGSTVTPNETTTPTDSSSNQKTTTSVVQESNNGTWLNWLVLVVQGFLLCVISIIGMRGGHLVDVSLLLAYFWLLSVFVAPVALTTVACFDFYQYLNIWFNHNWATHSFTGIRELFCSEAPETLCAVPFNGAPYSGMNEWCHEMYNSSDCSGIRAEALNKALDRGKSLTLAQGIIGIVVMCQIGASMYLCTRILTHSVITESMNDIINVLLILPIAGCIGIGSYIWKLRTLEYFQWAPYLFIALAAVQVVALPLGIIAGRLKSRPMLIAYIILASIVACGLGSAGVTSFLFVGIVTDNLKPTADEKNNLACTGGFTGCCCCDQRGSNGTFTTDLCPEWKVEEIVSLLQLDLKITGVVALVCLAYLIGSLTVAGLLNTDLRNYKTDYV